MHGAKGRFHLLTPHAHLVATSARRNGNFTFKIFSNFAGENGFIGGR